jgi:hypothetical protein
VLFQVLKLTGGTPLNPQTLARTAENKQSAETQPKVADDREQTESWGLKLPHISTP